MIKIGTDFSGVGAPEQALKELNIKHTIEFACDTDHFARETYLANHSAKILYNDITERDNNTAPEVDLYCFGFPCQAFSLSGKRKGFDDIRGTLFFNSADYIRKKQPKMFIAENVKGLLSHDKVIGSKSVYGRTFGTIINLLAKTVNGQTQFSMYEDNLGYHIFYAVLNSKNFGVAQNRERVFIIGFKNPQSFSFPAGQRFRTKISDFLDPVVADKYYIGNKLASQYEAYNGPERNSEIILNGIVTKNSQSGKVFSPEGIFPTIAAGTHGYCLGYIMHNDRIRRLTERECFRLQGFDDSFKLGNCSASHLYKQAGNTITTKVLRAIIENINYNLVV